MSTMYRCERAWMSRWAAGRGWSSGCWRSRNPMITDQGRLPGPASGRTGQLKDPVAAPTHDVIIPA